MEINFSIRVVNDDGEPMEGVHVWCNPKGLSVPPRETTDEDGWAYFEWTTILDDYYEVRVYLDDKEVGEYTFYDGDSTSYTYPD